MKLSELKENLNWVENVSVYLENGTSIPPHFHLTELGSVSKHFIDCGGTVRNESVASLQLWYSNDTEHRLTTSKLQSIIDLSIKVLNIEDLEIEVEYQTDTIGRYALDFNGHHFILKSKQTACLASDACGVENELIEATNESTGCCAPGGKCC